MPAAVAHQQPAGAQLAETLRGHITKVAPTHADVVIASLVEAIKTTKVVKGHCGKCDAWVSVSVQDATAATNAIKVLIEQTEGRPGVAAEDATEATIVRRYIAPNPAAATLPALLELAESGDLPGVLTQLRAAITAAELSGTTEAREGGSRVPVRVNGKQPST